MISRYLVNLVCYKCLKGKYHCLVYVVIMQLAQERWRELQSLSPDIVREADQGEMWAASAKSIHFMLMVTPVPGEGGERANTEQFPCCFWVCFAQGLVLGAL